MNEMSKSHAARKRAGDYEWLKGDVLDIGCGPDPIKLPPPSTVRGWDLQDGDASHLATLEDKSFDNIVSAHCLEHLHDPEIAIQNWSRVLRDGGFCYILVPLYSAYEKFNDFTYGSPTPSRYNADHKTSWDMINLDPVPQNHPHYGYKEIVRLGKQAGLTLVDLRIETDGFNWERLNEVTFDQTMHGALAQLCIIYQKL